MKLNKNEIRILITLGVAIIVFNVIAFIIPFEKSEVFWISYSFGMVAILSQFAVMKIAFSNAKTVTSKFYGFPIARIGLIYLLLQVFLSVVFMAIGLLIPIWVSVLIYILLFFATVIGLVSTDSVRDEIEKQDLKIVKSVSLMRNLQSKMNLLVSQSRCSESVKAEIEKISEELKYSDPVSGKATEEIEQELYFNIEELEKAVVDGDDESALTICKKAKGILAERNRLCKLNKNN